MRKKNITVLLGQTLARVSIAENKAEVLFETTEGRQYKLYHDQGCCEAVEIADVCGDLQHLVGAPILLAEEAHDEGRLSCGDHYTWTFYRFATVNGYVTMRWYGQSNGYYSEAVDFMEVSDAGRSKTP